jgi:transcriptional/translational regulatory protein YebC/TACO1
LENVTVEGMLKDQIAVIVECETDSKLRTLSAVRLAIKDFGFGTTTPTSYLFTRKGIITFEKDDRVGLDEAFDAALTGGALDLDEDEHGRVVVFTEPGDVRAAGDAISKALDLQIVTSDILWAPNPETKVRLKDETSALELINFADQLREMEPSVQSISINILHDKLQVSDEIWGELQARFNTG